MNKYYAVVVTLLVSLTSINPSQAMPMEWHLSGVTFNDNTSLTGSYFYDADTWTYSNWNITSSNGSGYLGPLPGFTYTSGNSGEIFGGYPHAFKVRDTDYWNNDCMCVVPWNGSGHELFWTLTAAMTNAGGTISFFQTGETYTDFDQYGNFRSNFRTITSGFVTTEIPVVEAPEPASMSLLGLGLVLMGFVRHRRRV